MKKVPLGRVAGTKDNIIYMDDKDRETHMHVIGATRTGKSKFLEHMIREDILEGNGLCLIDPHFQLYEAILKWIAENNLQDRRKIILLDPSEGEWIFGFNPLRDKTAETSVIVDYMVNACTKVWSDDDKTKPLLQECLGLLFHALTEYKLSLLESQFFINADHATLRKRLTSQINNIEVKNNWSNVNKYNTTDFINYFSSTVRRLRAFITSPAMRHIIGQTEQTLDFRKIMDEGAIVLVNLCISDKISLDNARVLGTLLINDIMVSCFGRPLTARPFYVYVDECQEFINEDFARILDQTSKFGLRLILSHQHLSHLKRHGEHIYKSVMTNARTKVVFGGLEYEDAEIMVKNIFPGGNIDLQEWKQKLTKPTIVGYVRSWFQNYAKGVAQAFGSSSGRQKGTGGARGGSTSTTFAGNNFGLSQEILNTMAENFVDSYFDSTSDSYSEVNSFSQMEGASEGLEPVLEDLPVESYSLQDQIWRTVGRMVQQPQRHAIIKLPNKNPQFMEAPFIKNAVASKDKLQRVKDTCFIKSHLVKSVQDVAKEIEERQKKILLLADPKTKPDPQTFWEKGEPTEKPEPVPRTTKTAPKAARKTKPDPKDFFES